ncbi:AlpA family phage regulatory protein [Burkholderia pseudomallei]|nr:MULTISPECIES: AlpA family phage regulatory protein [Burkholderia]MDY7762557.1 AlpA family phage regulatory protein [Burkholderia pseudomallei]TPE98206.1 AlpA family phage regulatory protein [Burkholderia pseudomallei]
MNEKHSTVEDKLSCRELGQGQLVRILPRPEVERVTGISRSLIYELARAGSFPKPVRLTSNRVGWLEHEVQEWIRAKAALRKFE